MAKFCDYCGARIEPGEKFCSACGGKLDDNGSSFEQKPPVAYQNQPKPTIPPQNRGQGSYSVPINKQKPPSPPIYGKTNYTALIVFLVIIMVVQGTIAGLWFPGFFSNDSTNDDSGILYQPSGQTSKPEGSAETSSGTPSFNGEIAYYIFDGIEETEISYNNSDNGFTVGKISKNGCRIHIDTNAVTAGSKISAKPLTAEKIKEFDIDGKFERIVCPVDISSPEYDGSPLGSGIELTIPMPKQNDEDNWYLEQYRFCYYDEENKEIHYLMPEKVDYEKNTMTISLPHFSFWWGAKLTKEETIEQFLDKYCMQQVIEQSDLKEIATELEPYINAKTEALGLTSGAAKDLAQSIINYLGSQVKFSGENGDTASDLFSMDVNTSTTLIRAYYDNDKEAAKGTIDSILNSLTVQLWKEGKYSERFANVFKKEYVKEFTPTGIDTLISNAGALGSVFGAIYEGDVEGAAEKVGEIMQGIDPAVEIGTKFVRLAALSLHTGFTYWKSNQIEELYKVYKNGARGLFGNEVEPRNKESFLRFLNTSSGFTMAKGIGRFYKLDKIDEVCKKYGWSFSSYSELPDKYRDIFDKRAEDALIEYFEKRASQETAAEKLKAIERESIDTMLNLDFGALNSSYYSDFFREDLTGGYDIDLRLQRVVNIRSYLKMFVDEDKLEKDRKLSGFNWGYIINWWVGYISQNSKEDSIDLIVKDLKEHNLLKDGMDAILEKRKREKNSAKYALLTDNASGYTPPDQSSIDSDWFTYTPVEADNLINIESNGDVSIKLTALNVTWTNTSVRGATDINNRGLSKIEQLYSRNEIDIKASYLYYSQNYESNLTTKTYLITKCSPVTGKDTFKKVPDGSGLNPGKTRITTTTLNKPNVGKIKSGVKVTSSYAMEKEYKDISYLTITSDTTTGEIKKAVIKLYGNIKSEIKDTDSGNKDNSISYLQFILKKDN